MDLPPSENCCVSIIGLGYVGLPLAVELGKTRNCVRTDLQLNRRVIGFDINQKRIAELKRGIDRTKETDSQQLAQANLLEFTSDPEDLSYADVFIVTVPTPIDQAKRPDLTALESASALVGRALKQRFASGRGSSCLPIVIYESTVYPGATEDVCVPIIEIESGLIFNVGFVCGYSPERINPGDSQHRLTTITKVTSGSTEQSATWIDNFYGSIIEAGTHKAPSLKVAEAAKVIENTQRDLNIALMNELAIIFRKMEIDTLDVLKAAGTKWNFLPFRPGLVGGHCIGVDPYYLTYKAETLGYFPQVVLAGRRINDSMGYWVVEQLVREMARAGMLLSIAKVLVLGLTFKEDCPDLRNTRVVDLLQALENYGIEYVVVDHFADPLEATAEYSISIRPSIPRNIRFKAVILAVAHDKFAAISADEWYQYIDHDGIFFDLKGVMPREINPMRL